MKGGMRVGFGALLGLDDFRKMLLQQDIMHICYRENIHMQKSHFPAQDFAQSSIMTESINGCS